MKSRTYIVAAAGGALTIYLFIVIPQTAASQIVFIVAGCGALITLLDRQDKTEAKVDSAIKVSEHNASALQTVSAQVDQNTVVTEHVKEQSASTHELVNGHMGEWRAALEEVAALKAQIAELAGTAAGRETGRQIAIELLATNAVAPDVQPDGTVVVTAPALIAVRVPEAE